ncbi:MAG: 4-hydroxy-tetrahydrodipicolinate reductase [Candidatus Eisenbacteria bacterium]|nr:4-hydroxy-tetrahydrodipicolinate reductase [Candidatus Eisenbacteria bacterium]
MISLVLVGAAGRMGRAVEEAARAAGDFELRALVDRAPLPPAGPPAPGRAALWTDDARAVIRGRDVVIEFSSPESCRGIAALCAERGASLVSGTSGLSAEDENVLRAAARKVPVLRASNFSLGVAALHRALESALKALPRGWDVEIIERHHRKKADSPSGTALSLASLALAARGLPAGALRHGREGRVGERPTDEIGVHAVRGGSWVGDHAVLIAGEGEWIELRHVAQDRGAFAAGALAAARFVARAGPGLYTLSDVLRG